MHQWKRSSYTKVGICYLLATLPAVVLLVMGQLLAQRSPYVPLSLGGIPLGVLFLLVGRGTNPRNNKTEIAVRISLIALTFVVCVFLSMLGVKAGVEPLQTSVLFSAMTSSYVSFLVLVFMIAGALDRKPAAPQQEPRHE